MKFPLKTALAGLALASAVPTSAAIVSYNGTDYLVGDTITILFDGFTNRKGWTFYAVRELFANTELNLTLYRSAEIEDDRPTYADSLVNADRFRLQTDLVVRFCT